MKLHGTVGPAGANVSAIANEAGVQRATVYRHFPDDVSLFNACTAHFYELNPMPDPETWKGIGEPDARLRHALGELYRWYERVAPTLYLTTIRDADLVPSAIRERGLAYADAVRTALMRGRPERGRKRRRVSAAIGHATAFPTYLSLTRQQGLSGEEAVGLMSSMVDAASR